MRIWLTLTIGLTMLVSGCSDSSSGSKNLKDLVIFQTNDRHSHFHGLLNYDDALQTDQQTVGGADHWMKLVEDTREDPDVEVLLLSAGDFSMGTMLVAAEDNAADLNFMKEFGYTAAAIGNHELDWGPARLAAMIEAADQPPLPLLSANMVFSDDPGDDTIEALYGPHDEPGKLIHPWMVHETPGGTRVGIFGLLGIEAAGVVPQKRPVTFSSDMDEMAATAQQVVDTLRDEQQVDLVLCLAHLGVHGSTQTGESTDLAERVEGIDIVLSGHNHTPMAQAVEVPCMVDGSSWTTTVMEAGKYGLYLGRYDVNFEGDKPAVTGTLIDVDESLGSSTGVVEHVAALVEDIESNFLPLFPLQAAGGFLDGEYFQQLVQADFDIRRHSNEPNNMGYLAADAMREAGGCDLAVASNGGDIRHDVLQRNADGGYDVADTFIVSPLGIGPDGIVGYPVVKFHLTLNEIWVLLEGTVADLGLENNDYMLSTSGIRLEMDTSKSQYGRILTMEQYEALDESGEGTLLYDLANGGFQVDENTTCVSVCTTSYIASFLPTFGFAPRDEQCETIGSLATNPEILEDLILRDADDREMKLWYLIMKRLASMDSGVDAMYDDDQQNNPLGPYWRRAWDLARHPAP